MITDNLKNGFKKDVSFSGWTDCQNLSVSRKSKNSLTTIIGEVKGNSSSNKIQIINSNGVNIRFLEGNKITKKAHWATAIQDASLEGEIASFLNVSFGEGRLIYRSLMKIISINI